MATPAKKHKVKQGETLSDIAKLHYNDARLYKALARYNHIENPDMVYSGKSLIIPPSTSLTKLKGNSSTSQAKSGLPHGKPTPDKSNGAIQGGKASTSNKNIKAKPEIQDRVLNATDQELAYWLSKGRFLVSGTDFSHEGFPKFTSINEFRQFMRVVEQVAYNRLVIKKNWTFARYYGGELWPPKGYEPIDPNTNQPVTKEGVAKWFSEAY
jgi:LysM repeat protein